jgi:NAD-dependent dihydropyrimidine dehydrogenase PreA subunit
VPHYITQTCIGKKDGSCVEVCPVDCIHPRPDEPAFDTAEMLFINPDTCIDCGLCVDECPVNAIYSEDDIPDDLEDFIDRNAAFFKNP